MGRWRWTVNLGSHYEPPIDQTGPATIYPNRSGALPADSGDRTHLDVDHPWAEGAAAVNRVSRNRSARHRRDR